MKKYDKIQSRFIVFKNHWKDWKSIIKAIGHAFVSGSFLITVSYKVKNIKVKDLNHVWMIRNYPTNAILHTFVTLYNDLEKKEIVIQELYNLLKEKNGEKNNE